MLARPRLAICLTLVALAAAPLAADEEMLARAFVGNPVLLLMDLPATTSGLDYYPERQHPIDAAQHQQRLMQNGVGVRRDDVIAVTMIKVKKKHIEFQLGAGGLSQMPSRPSVYVPVSRLEEELQDQLEKASSEAERKRLRARLAEEQDQREREQRRREARAEEQHLAALSARSPEEWALLAGSRINVRFDDRIPAAALAPEGFAQALSGVVDFNPPPAAVAAQNARSAVPSDSFALPLRKGQRREDLEARFGPSEGCLRSAQAGIKIDTCAYDLGEATLEAGFADGLLVRYVITSR
jgi:hypothetical protein